METRCMFCGTVSIGNKCLACGMNKDDFVFPKSAPEKRQEAEAKPEAEKKLAEVKPEPMLRKPEPKKKPATPKMKEKRQNDTKRMVERVDARVGQQPETGKPSGPGKETGSYQTAPEEKP